MLAAAAAGSVAHFVFIHHDVYYTWVTFAKGLRWVPSLSLQELSRLRCWPGCIWCSG
jgi:hypothetical protein